MPVLPGPDPYFNSRPCERGDWYTWGASIQPNIFQFTPLREGRRAAALRRPAHTARHQDFNSRPCERGDLLVQGCGPLDAPISIHAPARGATQCATSRLPSWGHFNSRPCERGDPIASRSCCTISADFNSRPCERGDARSGVAAGHRGISIHAPARGATFFYRPVVIADSISIHAPARGATEHGFIIGVACVNFNSRPCERGDLARSGVATGHRGISIHAPARGATAQVVRTLSPPKHFNSRPCERGDSSAHSAPAAGGEFQFTPLREGRRAARWRATRSSISIHAPARGATSTGGR